MYKTDNRIIIHTIINDKVADCIKVIKLYHTR